MRIRVILVSALLGLVPSVQAKDVLVVSEPPGAQVIVDGRVLGRTPLNTTKKEIMPTWFTDGVLTSAHMQIELPLYESQSRKFNEFRVPKLIEFVLVKQDLVEHFENYLQEVDGLARRSLASTDARISSSSDPDADGRDLFGQGFVMVGYLGVTAEVAPMDLIRQRASELGAARVLVNTRSAESVTELRQVTSRSSASVATSTAFVSATSGSHSAYGSGTGISFIPGRASTEFVPFEKRQYDVQAAFWRKRAPNRLGAYFEPIPPTLRQAFQRNTGALVIAIEDESPAFYANILPGDVIISVDNQDLLSADQLLMLLEQSHGISSVSVLRNGSEVAIDVAVASSSGD